MERKEPAESERGARLSCATQEVVAPVVDRHEHETRVSTYESPEGTFPCAAPRRGRRDFIPRAISFEELPAARAEEGSVLSFMYESRSLVIVVPQAREAVAEVKVSPFSLPWSEEVSFAPTTERMVSASLARGKFPRHGANSALLVLCPCTCGRAIVDRALPFCIVLTFSSRYSPY